MPRGGKRSGTAGKPYPNRSDLRAQPVKVAPSKTYGDGAASAAAQRAMPLPQAPAVGAGAVAGMPAAPAPMPGALPLGRPSDRPAEPSTAGMAMGPGPGPSAAMPAVDPVLETLRASFRAFPNESTAALIEKLEAKGRQ